MAWRDGQPPGQTSTGTGSVGKVSRDRNDEAVDGISPGNRSGGFRYVEVEYAGNRELVDVTERFLARLGVRTAVEKRTKLLWLYLPGVAFLVDSFQFILGDVSSNEVVDELLGGSERFRFVGLLRPRLGAQDAHSPDRPGLQLLGISITPAHALDHRGNGSQFGDENLHVKIERHLAHLGRDTENGERLRVVPRGILKLADQVVVPSPSVGQPETAVVAKCWNTLGVHVIAIVEQ